MSFFSRHFLSPPKCDTNYEIYRDANKLKIIYYFALLAFISCIFIYRY